MLLTTSNEPFKLYFLSQAGVLMLGKMKLAKHTSLGLILLQKFFISVGFKTRLRLILEDKSVTETLCIHGIRSWTENQAPPLTTNSQREKGEWTLWLIQSQGYNTVTQRN